MKVNAGKMRVIRFLLFGFIFVSLLLFGCQKSIDSSDVGESQIGKIIKVKGEAKLSDKVLCTKQHCDEDNPCCNDCQGKLTLDKKLKLNISCSGTNCEMKCEGFDLGEEYVVKGKLVKKDRLNAIEWWKK